MRAISYRPGGQRLLSGASQKIKGIIAVPPPANNASLWASWPWTNWIKPQIDAAVALGANTIAMTSMSGQYLDGSVPQSQMAAQLTQYLDYVANKGLMSYDGPSIAANWPGLYGYPAIKSLYAWWHSVAGVRPNRIGWSLVNEINAQNVNLTSTAAANIMANLVPYARTLTSVPVTASLTLNTKAMMSDAVAQAVIPWCDFIDYHPYYRLLSGTVVDEILPADITPLRAQRWWKPFLIGESGQAVSTSTGRQTATWDANRQIVGMQDCLGAMGFSVTDYENTQQWGVYAPASSTTLEPKVARSACLTPFAAWPARS